MLLQANFTPIHDVEWHFYSAVSETQKHLAILTRHLGDLTPPGGRWASRLSVGSKRLRITRSEGQKSAPGGTSIPNAALSRGVLNLAQI